MNTRDIFKQNLNYFINRSGKNKKVISEEMGIPYTTLVEWANGKKFPRADGIERLANYFGIQKSDLLEEKRKTTANPDVTDDDIKFALFNGDVDGITDEMYEEVKAFAQFVKNKYKKKD